MGIKNISALFPDGFPYSEETVPDVPDFVVGAPDGNGVVRISGPDSMVSVISGTRVRLNAPQVTDHGDGSATVTSA